MRMSNYKALDSIAWVLWNDCEMVSTGLKHLMAAPGANVAKLAFDVYLG